MRNDRISRRRFLAQSAVVAGASVTRIAFAQGPDASKPTLKTDAARAKLLFGFAVDAARLLRDATYRQFVEGQCSILTAENDFKFDALAPTPDTYSFAVTDALLSFCERSDIKLRGTPLVWHSQLPGWFAAAATPKNARQLMTHHIRTVAGHFTGRMHSWDVVNEAIELGDGRPDGLRNSPWLKLVGPSYIDIAFRTARSADPTALLTYNDYDLENESPQHESKRKAVLAMVRGLKKRQVPIDAVGIQSHLAAGDTFGPGLLLFIDACREMGLQVFVSELDVDDHAIPVGIPERDRSVANTYERYLRTALAQPNVTAVITWGVTDANSWLGWLGRTRADGKPLRPLLFDDNYKPTAAFTAAHHVFEGIPQRTIRAKGPKPRRSTVTAPKQDQ